MIKIGLDNYEVWFLDFLEGNLNKSRLEELDRFLSLHPEMKEELHEMELLHLPAEKISFKGKSGLKHTPADYAGVTEEDYQCIAFMEGDMNRSEQIRFKDQLKKDKNLKRKLHLFTRTRLVPDASVFYPGRARLKKKRRLVSAWIYPLAAAVVTGLAFWLWPGKTPEVNHPHYLQMAVKESLLDLNKNDITLKNSTIQLPAAPGFMIPGKENRNIQPMAYLPRKSLHHLPVTVRQSDESGVMLAETRLISKADDTYETLYELALRLFRERILGEPAELVKKQQFTLWEVADVGVQKLNNLMDTGIDIEREYNSTGNLKKVNFNSRLLALSLPHR